MQHQKHLFALDPQVHYLNCAAYSPTLLTSLAAAERALHLKGATPYLIRPTDHFETADRLRQLVCQLLFPLPHPAAQPNRVAIIPAASYGLAIVAANLHRMPDAARRTHLLFVGEEFPNQVYAFERVCRELGWHQRYVERPTTTHHWTEHLLENIQHDTAAVVMPQVHWIYGTLFDVEAVGRRCREVGALLVLDLSQSLGALPYRQDLVQADAIVCASYKWLLGAYGLGVAWFGAFFDNGVPIEEGWMNRTESHVFSGLTRYLTDYRPLAQRYNMGEFSQFVQLPLLEDALQQILHWTPDAIQHYAVQLSQPYLEQLEHLGCSIEHANQRPAHLIYIGLPENINNQKLAIELAQEKVFVSVRGAGGLRVATHLFNTPEDWLKFYQILKNNL